MLLLGRRRGRQGTGGGGGSLSRLCNGCLWHGDLGQASTSSPPHPHLDVKGKLSHRVVVANANTRRKQPLAS